MASPEELLAQTVQARLDEQLSGLPDDVLEQVRANLSAADLTGAMLAGQRQLDTGVPLKTVLQDPDTGDVAVRLSMPSGLAQWAMCCIADGSVVYDQSLDPLDARFSVPLFTPGEG